MPANIGSGKHFIGHRQHRRRVPDVVRETKADIEALCRRAESTGDWSPVLQRQAELIGCAK